MIKETIAQQLEEKSPGKLASVAPAYCSVKRVAACQQTFRGAMILVLVSLGLFANAARAQVVGIAKLFDPASQQQAPAPEAVVTGNGIEYHGGPIMPGPHNVYFIWYGNWTGNNATTILPELISGFSGSLYFNTNTTYGDNVNNIANTVTMAGQHFDNYSKGTALTNATLLNVISASLNSGALPVDSNGIYFVLTSPDVAETDFCTTFCGFHSAGTFGPTDIKFAFVGNPATQCPHRPGAPSCSAQTLTPNQNEGADAMANVIAHELNETVTDPDLNA
jgi:hypothetical protein